MSANYFHQIAQEIRKQKQLMDQLEAENRELRRQLTSLRRGEGIGLEIFGIHLSLRDDLPLSSETSTILSSS